MEAACEDVISGTLTFAKAAKKYNVDLPSLRSAVGRKSKAALTNGTASSSNGLPVELEEDVVEPSRNELIMAARKAVIERGISARAAAKEFKVPSSTLRSYVKHPEMEIGRRGAKSKFTKAEETEIEKMLLDFAAMGVPLGRPLLAKIVAVFATAKGLREERQKSSHKWQENYLKHYPVLGDIFRLALHRRKSTEWNTKQCAEWIALLTELIQGGMVSPGGIWNVDIASMDVPPVYNKLSVAKYSHPAQLYFSPDLKPTLQILTCASAAGAMLRPLMKVTMETETVDTDFGAAWDDETMTNYFRNDFIPNMTEEKNYVFVDLRFSHWNNLELMKLCLNSGKNIRLVCIPSCQTGRLLPLHIAKCILNGSEPHWGQYLRELHPHLYREPLSMDNLTTHLLALWPLFKVGGAVREGFANTGTFPFDQSLIESVKKRKFTPRVWTKPELYAEEKQQLKDTLARMNLTPADITAIITEAERRAKFNSGIVDPPPKKKKQKV